MPRSKRNTYNFIKIKRTTKEERRLARIGDLDNYKMMKEVNRHAKKSIEPRITKEHKEPLRLGAELTPEMFAFEDDGYDPMDMPESYERTETGWEEELDKWVSLYLRALGRGKPSAVLTTPEVISGSCACRKMQRTMSLYMLHGNYFYCV
jgi:hypothetical protein